MADANPPAPAAKAAAPDWEERLPEGQRKLNRFIENWIFAFMFAMAIRHFGVEAFRIPTGSMEPMLYGDPGFLKGDHVVVDKISHYFRAPQRWDVTVFQFPEPEVEEGDDNARPAITEDGTRLEQWPTRPLMYRNFVKRLVALPGDVFYIANGQLYLKGPDGAFRAAKRPPQIQEAVWLEIYRAGAQEGYLPWVAAGAAAVDAGHDGQIRFRTAPNAACDFTQPFRNLYLKPGVVEVQHKLQSSRTRVQVSLIAPEFTVDNDQGSGTVRGNIWDMDNWSTFRLNSSDIDNNLVGTDLSLAQTEWVGNVRIQGRLAAVDGEPAIVMRHGTQQGERLVVTTAGWRVEGIDGQSNAKPMAQGPEDLRGHVVGLAHVADQVVVSSESAALCAIDVPPVDPELQRTHVSIEGQGSLEFASLRIQRDLHYTSSYVLSDYAQSAAGLRRVAQDPNADDLMRDKDASALRDMERVRLEFGAPPGAKYASAAWGVSPQTAVTVPPHSYLMMGDNSPTSWDGRAWGFVPEENLRGRALLVVLPPSRWRIVR